MLVDNQDFWVTHWISMKHFKSHYIVKKSKNLPAKVTVKTLAKVNNKVKIKTNVKTTS